jgi:hypothetical protein
MKDREHPSVDLVERMCYLTEVRMQKFIPAEPGYYRRRICDFWRTFKQNGAQIEQNGDLVLIGNSLYFDFIATVINPELTKTRSISGKAIEPFFVFIGDGATMCKDYRLIGDDSSPYPFAISGALDCYLNTDWFEQLGVTHPATYRAITHETRHVEWNLALTVNGNPTFQIDRNDVIREALGGPLDLEKWRDVPDVSIDIGSLGFLTDFYDWLSKQQNTLGYHEPYFLNPIVKAFYTWAIGKGNETFWFEEAKKIPI